MKFTLSSFADEVSSSLDEQIKAMHRNGIELLEIRQVDGENIADIDAAKAKNIRERLDNAGIRVWSIGSPYGKSGIEDSFEPQLERFRRGLELAGILGAERIRIFSFYIPDDKNPSDYKEEVIERLGVFVEEAKKYGIMLCHENEKRIYGDIATRCADILKALPELRAVFDPANFIQCGQDTVEAWNMLKEYVEYMHIKDALADGMVVPAGEGIGNIPYLLSEFKGTVLSIEPHLTVFDGLDSLEPSEKSKINKYYFPSSGDAFDAAVNSLKSLIQ